MSRLTKAQAKAHNQAEKLLAQDVLTHDEKVFVIKNWQESATSVNSAAGAFFTPLGLAVDFTIECGDPRTVIDLCAGIGTLSYALQQAQRDPARYVCVEANPDYVRVGRKILPEATWINGSIFDLDLSALGRFDLAISNPPFGRVKRDGSAPRYTSGEFEYHVVDIAAHLADYGAFILPQGSLGWTYSHQPYYRTEDVPKHDRFRRQTGVSLDAGCGIDTSVHADDWNLVKVKVEVAVADFAEEGGVRLDQVKAEPPAQDEAQEPDLFDLIGEAS